MNDWQSAFFDRYFHKAGFYVTDTARRCIPSVFWRLRHNALVNKFNDLPLHTQEKLRQRAHYYNRLSEWFEPTPFSETIGDFNFKEKSSAYCHDFQNLICGFPAQAQVSYRFGDVTEVPLFPSFVKSRPISRNNRNSVLLKLNSVRHYWFIQDPIPFADKIPLAVWRGKSNNPLRIELASKYKEHPLCNIGCIRHKEPSVQDYHREFLSVSEQLRYRFVLSVEGVDVATNLKWIMASNSLCMMRKPRFETWFMEGTLKPGVHYVELMDDYSDLADKIDYYNRNPSEAMTIIANAQAHAAMFRNHEEEQMVAMLVIHKFLELSGQLDHQNETAVSVSTPWIQQPSLAGGRKSANTRIDR